MGSSSVFGLPASARLAIAIVLLSASGATFAAHPIISEDPGTQGTGHFEFEAGFSAIQGDPAFGRGYDAQPQLSYGVIETLDVIVQSTYSGRSGFGTDAVSGPGDTSFDIKWRFHESGPLALAVRAGVDATTGDARKGLGADDVGYHAVAILGWTETTYQLLLNAAYLRVRTQGARADIGRFTAALLSPADARVQGFVEAATQSNADPARSTWPAVARTGLIYSLTTWLDVDLGYQSRLNRVAPRQVILAGATLRW